MAGPGKGTWVKVKGKNGAVRTEVIGATVGGNNYSKGEVISQSEYQKTQERKSEGGQASVKSAGDNQTIQKQEGKRLQKAALSKAEKTQILLKNKKRLKAEAMKTEGGYDRVKRLNRIEAADRKRRKAENPNAPSFRRAQKGNQTKYLKSLGIDGASQVRRLEPTVTSELRKGNVIGAMDRVIKSAEKAKKDSQSARFNLNRRAKKIDRISKAALDRFKPL